MSDKKNVPKIRFPGFTEPWEQRKLGEIATFINGRAYSQDELLNSGKYKVLRVGNFYTNDFWYYSDMELDDKYYAENGDLLYTWSATFGPHIWHGNKVIYHYHIWKIELSKALEKNFALQLLERDKQAILSDKNGSTMVHITKAGMERKEVLLPKNIVEQVKIGQYFTNLDHLITLHQRKLEHVKKMKKSMLQKMFPKKNQLYPEVRFPGFTDAWEQRKLGEVVEFLDTMRKPLEGAKRISGPYPYYGASGIVDYVDGYLFDEELILLSEDGANITDRNYPVCFLTSGKYWVNNHAHVLKTKEGNENNFICNSLERKDYKQYNTGMAMPKLNQEVCKGIPISCPTFAEQKKIGDYFRRLDHLITLHQRELDHLQLLKKGMLQQMFI